ncbi:MAG: amidohydrolase family protein [Paracoccaceae bacterium]|nr:amidohydrolase family protein [Paracoccaceae bacterium]
MIDTHVHVWTDDAKKYPWQQTLSKVPIPTEPAKVEKFIACMEKASVEAAVLVQPSTYGWDNNYLCDSLKKYPNKFAGVCLVDPTNKNAPDDLSFWCQKRGCSGLRINLVGYSEIEFLLDLERKKLWDTVAEIGACISFQMSPNHGRIINELVKKRPEINFIVDQVSAEVHRNSDLSGFVESLSKRSNLYIKLNSVGQNSAQEYPFQDLWPFFKRVLDCFSPNRVLYGTDFPHTLKTCSYVQAIEWIYELPFISPDGIDLIKGENARNLWNFL